MKPIWQVCEFSDDVKFGRLDQSKFAVELHSVLDCTADRTYTDPKLFLSNTYPTSNMKYLLREALRRLGGKGGQPVFILDTEFGGGKTHSLILLLHVFKNPSLGTNYIRGLELHRESGVLEVPDCRVVAIDCRKISKNTLWGELADALGKYDEFKDEDLLKRPVRDISKLKALFDKPTLLLVDELPDHLLKASAEKIGSTNLSELTISFVLNLISAVSATKDSMLVLTLTGKQSLYERYVTEFKKSYYRQITGLKIEELDQKMKEALSRQAQYLVPVEKEEVSQVIRRRLVKSMHERAMNDVVNSYYRYLSEKGLVDIKYEERIRSCYPFHPFLIDVLYDRVSTIEEFNKTRGVLRLLALVLHRIYRDKAECWLVSPGDLPLEDPEVKDELTSRLGRGYFRPVVETDCIDKARELDVKKTIRLAEKVARTIYLYSLIGATKVSGIRPAELKLALCWPGMDPSLIDKVLDELDKELWYLKSEAGSYYFDKEPNINKIIHDYKAEVRSSEAREKVKETLESLLPRLKGVKTIVWDRGRLEDDEELKLFVVDYKDIASQEEGQVLEEILETREGGGIRSYRNTIVLILPEKEAVPTLEDTAKTLCAIEKAKRDERIKLDKEKLKKMNERLENTKGALTSDCLYSHLKISYPRLVDGQLQVDVIPFSGKTDNLTECVLNHLKRRGKLVEKLSSEPLRDMVSEKKKIRLEEVYKLFKVDRTRPFILSGELINEAVREGVEKGKFGYAEELIEVDGKYEGKIGEYISPSWKGWIISKELIYRRRPPVGPPPPPPPPPKYQYKITLISPKDAVDKLKKLRVISTGLTLNIRFSLDVHDKENTTSISIKNRSLARISELERIIEQLDGYYGKGSLLIYSDQDIGDELKKLGVEWS